MNDMSFETKAKIEYAAVIAGVIAVVIIPIMIMSFS